jgi:ABC-type spermidine/putrescine transport system permease subunit I
VGEVTTRATETLLGLSRILTFLTAEKAIAVRKENQTLIKSLVRDVRSLVEHANFLNGKANFLLDAVLGIINVEQNAIIKTFTVASVALMPPTLIASIYGMNFEKMPELQWNLGYPLALAMSRAPPHWRARLIVLAIAPFWTSFLVRVYAWIVILKNEGLLNHALLGMGIISEPLHIFATEGAVLIGLVYAYLPFTVLPIFNALEKQDDTLVEAALDLGATRVSAFWTVTFPLSLPGLYAGALLMFIPATGEFVIPDLLGGSGDLMIGRVLWSEFFSNRDWPMASAAACVLLCVLLAPLLLFERAQSREANT